MHFANNSEAHSTTCRCFSEGSRKYPLPESDYVLGLCTGSFAAAAISTSQTIFDLIPASVEAVLVAFRTALCSLDLSRDIEQSPSQHGRSWSASVNLGESEAKAFLREFCANKVRMALCAIQIIHFVLICTN
jgi:naphtho-gamma-pyrone polyketide synthase